MWIKEAEVIRWFVVSFGTLLLSLMWRGRTLSTVWFTPVEWRKRDLTATVSCQQFLRSFVHDLVHCFVQVSEKRHVDVWSLMLWTVCNYWIPLQFWMGINFFHEIVFDLLRSFLHCSLEFSCTLSFYQFGLFLLLESFVLQLGAVSIVLSQQWFLHCEWCLLSEHITEEILRWLVLALGLLEILLTLLS